MRHQDPGETLCDFMELFLVVCPRCGNRASVRPQDPARHDRLSPRRAACGACGFTKTGGSGDPVRVGEPCDSYFGLPLWLQAPCCGRLLWAYNPRHLERLEEIVGARIRERSRDEKTGWRNQSLAGRLPAWLTSRKNRDEVLKALDRLKQRAEKRSG